MRREPGKLSTDERDLTVSDSNRCKTLRAMYFGRGAEKEAVSAPVVCNPRLHVEDPHHVPASPTPKPSQGLDLRPGAGTGSRVPDAKGLPGEPVSDGTSARERVSEGTPERKEA